MSAPPPGASPPMRRRAADAMPADAVRARNATTKTAAQLAILPPKKERAVRNDDPRHKEECVGRE